MGLYNHNHTEGNKDIRKVLNWKREDGNVGPNPENRRIVMSNRTVTNTNKPMQRLTATNGMMILFNGLLLEVQENSSVPYKTNLFIKEERNERVGDHRKWKILCPEWNVPLSFPGVNEKRPWTEALEGPYLVSAGTLEVVCYIMRPPARLFHGTSKRVTGQMVLERANFFGTVRVATAYKGQKIQEGKEATVHEFKLMEPVLLIAMDECRSINTLATLNEQFKDSVQFVQCVFYFNVKYRKNTCCGCIQL